MKNLSTLIKTVALVCGCSTSVLAAQPGHFYVTVNTGVFLGNFNSSYLDKTDTIPQSITEPLLQNGYSGGLGIGYNYLINPQYFLNGEIAVNFDSNSALFQSGAATAAFTDSAKIKHHIDFTLAPGIITNSSLFPYLKLGISYAALQDNLTSPAGYTPTMISYRQNKDVLGFVAGLGVKYALSNRIAIFSEANFHDYGTLDFPDFQNFSALYTHSAHLYTYGLNVGASYMFNA